MNSAFKSVEWILGATALLFFIFGRLVAPHYEAMLAAADPDAELVPMSKYCLWFALFLVIVLISRLIYRMRKSMKP